jgi:hypothetical protein
MTSTDSPIVFIVDDDTRMCAPFSCITTAQFGRLKLLKKRKLTSVNS